MCFEWAGTGQRVPVQPNSLPLVVSCVVNGGILRAQASESSFTPILCHLFVRASSSSEV